MRYVNHLRDGGVPSQHSNWNRKFFIVRLHMGTCNEIFLLHLSVYNSLISISGYFKLTFYALFMHIMKTSPSISYPCERSIVSPSCCDKILMLSGLFDQIIHSTENVDMIGLFKHLHSKVFLIMFSPCNFVSILYMLTSLFQWQVMLGLPMLEGTNPASCFPRTAIGYEATCYSRIWSEVWAVHLSWYFYCM